VGKKVLLTMARHVRPLGEGKARLTCCSVWVLCGGVRFGDFSFCGLHFVVLFVFFFLGFWLVILEYTSCVRRGALCFLIKLLLLIKKKESNLVWRWIFVLLLNWIKELEKSFFDVKGASYRLGKGKTHAF
jgi:hypothetical protein